MRPCSSGKQFLLSTNWIKESENIYLETSVIKFCYEKDASVIAFWMNF